MKNFFVADDVAEVVTRLESLGPHSERQWGRMTAAQALAHCSVWMESAVGDKPMKWMLIGRLLGPLVRSKMLGDAPMGRNSPTDPVSVVADPRDLEVERKRLVDLIQRFHAGGAARCTTHPHSFFGKLTPEQWARLMYKHVDHHLQQFGA